MERKNSFLKELDAPRDARFFLANERTFLSWIRTSVAIIGIGFVVSKFTIFMDEVSRGSHVKPLQTTQDTVYLGSLLTAFGGILIFLAAARFVHNRNRLLRGRFYPDVSLDLILAGALIVAALALTVYLIRSM